MTGKKNKLDKPDKQDKKEKSGKKRKSDKPGRKEKTGKDNKSLKQGKNNKSGKGKKLRKHKKKAKTIADSEHAQKHKTIKEEVAKETGTTASIATVKVAHQDVPATHTAPEPPLTTTTSRRHLPVRLILAACLIVLAGVWWGYQYWSTEPEVMKVLPYKTGIAPMTDHKSQPGTATREQRYIRPPLPVPEKKMARSPDIAGTENTDRSSATNPTENDLETATAHQQASRPVARQPQSRHRSQPYGAYQLYPGRGWPPWHGNYPQQPYYRQPGYFGSE